MIVVDASVLVEVLLQTKNAEKAEARLFDPGETLHAPHLVDAEVAHVVRRSTAKGDINSRQGELALTDLADLALKRYPHTLLLPRVWELRHNFSAYDAIYVALAELLDAPLLTRDKRLAAAPGHHARIEVV